MRPASVAPAWQGSRATCRRSAATASSRVRLAAPCASMAPCRPRVRVAGSTWCARASAPAWRVLLERRAAPTPARPVAWARCRARPVHPCVSTAPPDLSVRAVEAPTCVTASGSARAISAPAVVSGQREPVSSAPPPPRVARWAACVSSATSIAGCAPGRPERAVWGRSATERQGDSRKRPVARYSMSASDSSAGNRSRCFRLRMASPTRVGCSKSVRASSNAAPSGPP